MKLASFILKAVGGTILLIQVLTSPFDEMLNTQEQERKHRELISAIGDVVVLQQVQIQDGDAADKLTRIRGLVQKHVVTEMPATPKLDRKKMFFVIGAACIGIGEILSGLVDLRERKRTNQALQPATMADQ